MFELFKSIFRPNKKTKSGDNVVTANSLSTSEYLKIELSNCEEVKKECYGVVLSHLEHKTNINKTSNKLTVNEKKTLGINSRLSITQELIDVLTEKGLQDSDPKSILTGIYNRATFRQIRDKNIEKFQKLGIKKFIISTCNDGKECRWCTTQDGAEITVTTDINSLIDKNCTCKSHCRLVMSAKL